ncbi:MAG: reverse transcriptase, partial [gamma proteobacterium symbiont of Lucinoma myriamae]|nr:reverse transcriptase [gamma proteobacterium symbiont of Lucinoma myriamae]
LSDDTSLNLLEYVYNFKHRLFKACEMARKNLGSAQTKMKTWYDRKVRERKFQPGDKVLALLPIPGRPLQARYFGPYTVERKVNDVDYIVNTPGRRKQRQLCHINMLKEYHERENGIHLQDQVVSLVTPVSQQNMDSGDSLMDYDQVDNSDLYSSKLQNSDILHNLDQKLSHLSPSERQEITGLLYEYEHLFPDVPSRTDKIFHDVDVGDSTPVKQHPYRMNPFKQEYLKNEVQYLLENDFIEPSKSDWSSPCVLVPKPDKTYRMCTDYRKVNSVTKTDSYPIPRIDDCIDKIGSAKYVTKFDLLKGYWQVPLTERAKEVSAFVTPNGLYQYKVMPFGMKNSPATFQRLINTLTAGLDGCEAYIDDVIIYSDIWKEHIRQMREFFNRLSDAKLTVNLVKSEFCHARVTFLGHIVGQGQVKTIEAKVKAIFDFPVPTTRKELMRFLGMAGYYRKFCNNFSVLAAPLTNLLSKKSKFIWSEKCQESFDKVKAILQNSPVLSAPEFEKQFKLAVDASDIGAGAVLLQADKDNVDHPVCYFSKKFNKYQKNYSTIEKECLALILALQHFEVYLDTTCFSVIVYTDHNPLTFINKMKNKNQRLLRWSLALQEYNLDIRHIRGRDNVIADALSRAG